MKKFDIKELERAADAVLAPTPAKGPALMMQKKRPLKAETAKKSATTKTKKEASKKAAPKRPQAKGKKSKTSKQSKKSRRR